MVGAVVVRDGRVVGEGHHGRIGGPHAETRALAEAGSAARGATLYVNLEPCAHHGRTPPCADAVVAAGIARVVACQSDPDPRTAGRGFARLRAAGVEVEVGWLAAEAVELNLAFNVSHLLHRPAVTLKWAMSLDGKIATAGGESQWISGAAGRLWGLAEREAHDAILVGSGTLLADDPRLDRRLGRAEGPNLRVVLDRRLRTPPDARLLTEPGPVVVYTAAAPEAAAEVAGRRRALAERGAIVVPLAEPTPTAVLADLHDRGVRSVLVEGGAGVAGAFVAAGLYDRVAVDVAPLVIGGSEAPGPVGGAGVTRLADAARLDRLRVRRRGGDRILIGLRQGCLPDLLRSVAGS